MNHVRTPPSLNSAGFTLIEVLVSLLILAVGLLGVAALQFRGLQYNHDAYMRSQVDVLAYDIADRMRLNNDNAADYATPAVYTMIPPGGANACDEAAGTSAANDLGCWQNSVDRALPPDSTADVIADGGDMYTVRLTWKDREGSTHTVDYSFQVGQF